MVKSRARPASISALPYDVLTNLQFGWPCGVPWLCGGLPSPFASDAERRATWETYRDQLIANRPAGRRPDAWWTYEAAAPRDPDQHETAQLFHLGELQGEELAEVQAHWTEVILHVRRGGWYHAGRKGVVDDPVEAERLQRAHSGVPAEFEPSNVEPLRPRRRRR